MLTYSSLNHIILKKALMIRVWTTVSFDQIEWMEWNVLTNHKVQTNSSIKPCLLNDSKILVCIEQHHLNWKLWRNVYLWLAG